MQPSAAGPATASGRDGVPRLLPRAEPQRASMAATDEDLPLIDAPQLPYQPRDPQRYRPGIGLIGCGEITVEHLAAYRQAGYRVLALCDLDVRRAEARRDEYYPSAETVSDYEQLLSRQDIEVVDIATHPPERAALIEAALQAGKHVLSQKPFVEDLTVGRRLADLADTQGVRLAVNQNGRFAPHFSYLRQAVAAGMLGQLTSAHLRVHWDHSWIRGTPFEEIRHLILYDFAIHWFDMLVTVMDRAPQRVFASVARTVDQQVRPALLGQAVVEFDGAQASLVFDGGTSLGRHDATYVTGTEGTFHSSGPSLRSQQVVLTRKEGVARLQLEGTWFPDGFHGTMGELLCAIEEERRPTHDARNNLASLELCFAAVASAERGEAVVPGTVRALPAAAKLPP